MVDPDAADRGNRDSRFGDVRGDGRGDSRRESRRDVRGDARGDVRGDEDERLERCDERGDGELGEDRPLDVRSTRVRVLLCPWS